MKIKQRWKIVFVLLILHGGTVTAFDHYITVQGGRLYDGTRPFRFLSFNVPNLLMIEDNLAFRERNPWRLPNSYEIEDALRTIKDIGGTVARTYVLTVRRSDDPPGTPRHIIAPGILDEQAFRTMDTVLFYAGQLGVRLIVPFVDNWHWMGGVSEYAAWRGKDRKAFWTDPQIKADYQQIVKLVLERRNTITGVPYKADRAILAWELGNELREAPLDWIKEMAAFVHSIDSLHLLNDGVQSFGLQPEIITDPHISILSTHHYEGDAWLTVKNIKRNLSLVAGKKPYYLGEFGFFDLRDMQAIFNLVGSRSEITGALLWSLRFHNRDGGFYWHSEPEGKSLFKAYHYPGFNSAAEYDEPTVIRLLRQKAWAIQEQEPPLIAPPHAPRLLAVTACAGITWQGAVGASHYQIERSEDQSTWQVLATHVSDAESAHEPLFYDQTAVIGKAYYYRVKAGNQAGLSSASNVIGPVAVQNLALVDHLMDDQRIFRLYGKYSFASNNSRAFKEDGHRLELDPGSAVVYRVPGSINRVYVHYFVENRQGQIELAVASDDRQYHHVTFDITDCSPIRNDYHFWQALLVEAQIQDTQARYLRLTCKQKIQIGKIEIHYVPRNS